MVTAMQCIPEFHGSSEQLKPFIIQVNYFSAGFPAEANQGPLLNVVYTKLRGEALRRLPEIEADSWERVKQNLVHAFQKEKSIGSLIREIETLNQKYDESFLDYKKRALGLYRYVKDIPHEEN